MSNRQKCTTNWIKALERAYLIRDTVTQCKACVTGSSSIHAAIITLWSTERRGAGDSMESCCYVKAALVKNGSLLSGR